MQSNELCFMMSIYTIFDGELAHWISEKPEPAGEGPDMVLRIKSGWGARLSAPDTSSSRD